MTDGDEGEKTGDGPEHVAPGDTLPTGVSSSKSAPPEPLTVASPPTSTPKTEWTASDARGPLVAADGSPLETESAESAHGDALPRSDIASEPVAAETSTTPPATSPPPRRSAWPIAAGLMVGAAIGAIVALVVYQMEAGTGGTDPQVAALSEKVAALEAKPAAAAANTGVSQAVAELQTKVADLQKTVAGLPKAAKPGSAQPGSAQPGSAAANAPAFDPAPLQQKIAALATDLAALKTEADGTQGVASKLGDLDSKVGGLASTVAGLQKQAATSDSSLQAMQGQQKSLETKVGAPALAVVADSLVQQVDAGQPYATQLDALASLGADPTKLAVLKPNAATGVPSAKALAAGFAPLAEPILAIEHRAPPNAGFMERLKSGMMSLVSVRRADDVSGTDLSSRVGRLQADLAHDDIADAVATWTALPAEAKAKSDAWGAKAKISADATTAARALQSDAIAAMGGRKS